MTDIIRHEDAPLALAGQAADRAAARGVFDEYRSRRAANTLRAQDADLVLFARYLDAAGASAGDLLTPEAWRGVSWGLIAGFLRWLVGQGHAIASVNRALATVRVYAKLATQAGALTPEALAMIRTVSGYSDKEGHRIDEGREPSRIGHKKAESVSISREQAKALKTPQNDSAQAARDALLMCILLDQGLRCGEVALLQWGNVDEANEHLTFFRPKVHKIQTLRLSKDTRQALHRYRQVVAFYDGPLLLASDKTGRLVDHGMTTSAINQRVSSLGAVCGAPGLSPHDCRHYWATVLSRNGTQIKALQDAGGWSSPAMPLRYAESQRIANQGAEVD